MVRLVSQPHRAGDDVVQVQGAVEESNVQPILEITRMLSAQRSYVDAQNLIQSEGDLQTQTIDKLTQTT